VLTKMGVPIFIQPPSLVVKGDLTSVSVADRAVSFDVKNAGNSFFVVNSVTVTGVSKTGDTTFTKQAEGWYVLAGGTRHFQVPIPAEACAGTDRIKLSVASSLSDEKGNPSPMSTDVAVPAAACGASAK